MGRRRRRSRTALSVASGLSLLAAFLLVLDIADPGPRRAIITVCLVVTAATAFQAWHTARAREKDVEKQQARQQHAEQRLRGLISRANSDH